MATAIECKDAAVEILQSTILFHYGFHFASKAIFLLFSLG